jgi:ElaB/YqjD/DUF883 family membrane-anchored ribosome-binding protein
MKTLQHRPAPHQQLPRMATAAFGTGQSAVMATLSSIFAMPHMRHSRERHVLDLRTLARDAEHLLEATAEDLTDKTREARKRLADVVERVKTSCNELQEQSIESARLAIEQTDHAVRAHPYQSVGIAFGVGVLVGWLLPRK